MTWDIPYSKLGQGVVAAGCGGGGGGNAWRSFDIYRCASDHLETNICDIKTCLLRRDSYGSLKVSRRVR